MQKSWGNTASYFQSLWLGHTDYASAVEGIATVADFVASVPLNLGLHGWTSMHDLCIQQTDAFPTSGPYLRLSPLHSGLVNFRYIDTGIPDKQWVRTVSPEQAVGRFTNFLEQLRWVAKVRVAN
jgi:hypothetical protein